MVDDDGFSRGMDGSEGGQRWLQQAARGWMTMAGGWLAALLGSGSVMCWSTLYWSSVVVVSTKCGQMSIVRWWNYDVVMTGSLSTWTSHIAAPSEFLPTEEDGTVDSRFHRPGSNPDCLRARGNVQTR
ncbi:hypothetical protein Dimus_004349 [Dionaea muscipula]